jgi:hypothetical protein
MSESFKDLFEQSFSGVQFYPGAIIPAIVIEKYPSRRQQARDAYTKSELDNIKSLFICRVS